MRASVGAAPCAKVSQTSAVDRTAPLSIVCDDASVTRSVLIVDDHPSFRASARAILEADGFTVVGEAKDGASALTAIDSLHPDLVLLDIQLPDMSGFDVCAEIARSNGAAPQVVLVSSRDACDFGPLIEHSGARGFVAKAELSGDAVAALLQ
jgi:DNA-binding NarL/FixJ family response regulator